MKLKDMTIEQLRKYEEIKTARPRKDMILVRDLRKWAKAKVEQFKLTGFTYHPSEYKKRIMKNETSEDVFGRILNDCRADLLIKNFNLEDKV